MKNYKNFKKKESMKVIVTLGGPLNIDDCSPSSHLKSRLDETIKQYEIGDIVIVTGSRCQRLSISEAQVMSNYLSIYNIPSILEERALNTIENAIFVKPILDQLVPNKSTPVLIITSDFHIARATLIFLSYCSQYNLFFRPAPSLETNILNIKEPTLLVNLISRIPLQDTVVLNLIEETRRGYMNGVKDRIKEIDMCEETSGNTALHYSASFGFTTITTFLLDNNIKINSQNKQGLTPLHYAVKNGRVEDVWELLSRGANVHLKTINQFDVYQTLFFNRNNIPQEKYTVILLMLLRFKKNCKVWIRHAETNENFLKEHNRCEETVGIFDATITSNGYKMLEYINSLVIKYNLLEGFVVITSPLLRTLETTRIITNGTKASEQISVDHRIRERLNHTSSIGKPCSILKVNYNYDFSKVPELWWHCPSQNHNNTLNIIVEPLEVLTERIIEFNNDLQEKKVLIVTHGGVIRNLFERKVLARNCEAFEYLK